MTSDRWVLIATEVEAVESDDEDTTYLGFSNGKKQGRKYCTISCTDRERVYIEIDDQKWGCYEGIQRVLLRKNEVDIELNENGISSLGCVQILRIVLGEEVQQKYDEIEKVLKVLFTAERLVIDTV